MNLKLDDGYSLTTIVDQDVGALVEWLQEPEIHKATCNIPFPYTDINARQFVANTRERAQEWGRELDFAIRDPNQKLIGMAAFVRASKQSHVAVIGYWLAKPFWNKGVMSSAVNELVRIGFDEFKFDRLEATTFPFNDASGSVLMKCGFKFEGYLRQNVKKDNQLWDSKVYGMIRSDRRQT